MADKTILVRVSADVGAYQAQMAAAMRSTQGFSAGVNSAVAKTGGGLSAMSRVASTFGKLVTIGVAGGLALSAKAAIDFNSSFAGVEKTLSASPAQFARLRQEIRGLAKEIPLSVNELNRIAELGGQLGVDVGGIEQFTDTIARLGVTTNLSTEQAALGLARFNAILGLADTQFEAVGSTIVGLGNNFATTEDQILTFALRIAPVGKTVGLTADQVLSLATAFSSVGVPAERGGTAVQKTLVKIADAVKSGGKQLQIFAAVAGQTSEEFAEAFERNAGRAFADFINGLGQIEESGGNVFDVLRNLGLANERTVGSLLAVANGGDILNRSLREGSQAWRDNNALLIESDKRFDTTASKMTIATNKIKDFGIGMGQNLLPIIEEVVGTLGNFFEGLSQLPKAAGFALTSLLAVTVASVALNKVAQKMAFGLGVQVPAGFGKAAFAARAFNAAIGLGMIGAVSLLVTWIAKMGEEKADAARKVSLLVDALKTEEDQLAATTKAAVIAGFTDKELADFQQIGVSAGLVADAILEDAAAVELLNQKISEIPSVDDLGALTSGKGFNQGQSQAISDARAVERVLKDVAEGTLIYKEAQAALNAELQENKDRRLLEAQAQGFNSIREAEYAAALASGEMQKAFKGLGGEALNTADDVQEFIDRFEEAVDAMYQETDAAFAFIDATEALAEGLIASGEAGADNVDSGVELARLWEDLKRAGADLGAQGIQPVIDRLWEMNQAGLITDAQYVQMLQHLALFEPVAGIVGSSSVNIANAMAFIGGNADLASVDVRNLINMLIGLDAASYTAFTNLARAIKLPPVVQNLLNAFLPGDVGENINKALNTTSNLITGFLGGYQDIGAAIDKAMAGGIGGSGKSGGGGGGGGGSKTEKAVEDVLESALEKARDGVRDIENAINAIVDYRAGLKEIADLENEQITNRQDQIQLTRDLAEANRDLARARSEAAKVTLDEQLAIEVAQEALLRAQLAFEQGVITSTELAIAKRNLQDAIDASTNVDDNEDVIAATENIENIQEDINDVKARGLEITEEIYDAQLDMIDAYLDLVEAGEAFNDVGKEALATFRAIAETIGLSTAEIDALLKAAGEAGSTAISFNGDDSSSTSSKGEFTGSGSSRKYVVKAGDTLSAIAKKLGITLTQLLKLNPQITNPNLIYPGDIIKYHRGGVVPGVRGVEQIAKVLPGEIILNPALGQFPSSNVTIGQLVVQGVFDPTRPQIADQIMTTIERELQNRRVGRVGSRA